MNVGFLGLGNMGRPMASNLMAAGHRLTVYNRTRSRADDLAANGADVAETPAAACAAEVVITMLADDDSVTDAVLGAHGVLSALSPSAIHICMSTISQDLSRRLTDAHKEAGRAFISAPVLGRPEVAEAGALVIIPAGDPTTVAQCQPLFEAMGKRIVVVGEEPHMANVLKLCCNFLVVSAIESMAESHALARKSGIDPEAFQEIIGEAMFPVPAYQVYGAMMAKDTYEPAGFRLPLGLKDIRLALEAAEAANVPMPIGSVIRDQFITALARGYENFDWGGLGRVSADNAGLKPKK